MKEKVRKYVYNEKDYITKWKRKNNNYNMMIIN